MFGRLGLGSQKDELLPVKLNFDNPNGDGIEDSVKIVGIAAGAYHSLALAGSVTILHSYFQLVFSPSSLMFCFNLLFSTACMT
jgi:hypothetical protein